MGRTITAPDSLFREGEPQQARTGFYNWSFPGAPIQIHLDLTVVTRLAHALDQGLSGSGLLLGSASEGTTEITDFQLLPDSDDPQYELAIERAVNGLGPARVVGFYRTDEDELLHLNATDYSLADAHFPEQYCVFLLIRTAGAEPAVATFFFRDERGLNGDFPFLEFPFDASRLQSDRRSVAAQPMKESPGAPSAPAAPAPLLAAPAAPAARPAGPQPAAVLPAAPRRRVHPLRALWMFAVAACILGGAAYGGFRVLPGILAERETPIAAPKAAAQPVPAPSLGLRAERQNSDLKLSWNRDSAAIAGASSGTLSILDGDSRRELLLTAAQVRGGSLLYSPSTDQVQMQLAVSGQAGEGTESVIVILPKGGAPQVRPLAPAAEKAVLQQAQPVEAARPLQASKPFVPPKSQVKPAAPPLIDTPPAAMPNASPANPAVFLNGQLRAPPQPAPKAPEQQASAAQPAANPPVRVLAPVPYHQPVLLRQVIPVVPQVVKSMLLTARTVEVLVSIDAAGKVLKAEGVAQPNLPRMLVASAETAALQCQFQPARSGDNPVPSEMLLRFQFKPAR